jgi:pimeloyl-ACP methyl ester carboxylesterase
MIRAWPPWNWRRAGATTPSTATPRHHRSCCCMGCPVTARPGRGSLLSSSPGTGWSPLTSAGTARAPAPRPIRWRRCGGTCASSPTLVIGGGSTSPVPQQLLAKLAGLVPDATLVTIEGAGHAVHRTRPAEFLSAVRPFLQRIRADLVQRRALPLRLQAKYAAQAAAYLMHESYVARRRPSKRVTAR